MRATGIVRRIDELGRVVIPKEIRRTLRIREGDHYHTTFTDMLQRIDAITKLAKAFGTVNRGEKRDAVMN